MGCPLTNEKTNRKINSRKAIRAESISSLQLSPLELGASRRFSQNTFEQLTASLTLVLFRRVPLSGRRFRSRWEKICIFHMVRYLSYAGVPVDYTLWLYHRNGEAADIRPGQNELNEMCYHLNHPSACLTVEQWPVFNDSPVDTQSDRFNN